jgi:DNA-binding Lrp family transcriptional regulator
VTIIKRNVIFYSRVYCIIVLRLKTVESKLIRELLKGSRRSDRELAEALGTSQPTVTRTRVRLEKEKIIKEYTMIPDLGKLGFEILAITLLAFDKEPDSKDLRRALGVFENILMFERGLGLKSSHVVVSVHKNFSSYAEFERRLKLNDRWSVTGSASFLVNLHDSSDFLSFSALARDMKKTTS